MTTERSGPPPGEREALARTLARLAKHVELALVTADLSPPQYRTLAFLSQGGELASVLAGQLDVSRPTVTALVDGLVARGLVERVPDPADRRCIQHVITDQGRAALAAGDAAVAAHLDHLAEHLAPATRRRAVQGLLLWREAIVAHHRTMAAARAGAAR